MEEVINVTDFKIAAGSQRVQEFIKKYPLISFAVLPSGFILMAGAVIAVTMGAIHWMIL